MKNYKLTFYILLFSFIWISCDSDEVAPEIVINSPLENSEYFRSQTLTVDATITDNEELDLVTILISGPNDNSALRKIEVTGKEVKLEEEFDLLFEESGIYTLQLSVSDREGNFASEETTFNFSAEATGTIDFNVRLLYQGDPLVMFEDYNYPDGSVMNFTRCSFYTSDMKLDETVINEVEFHNLTNSHAMNPQAIDGYTWQLSGVPTGSYSNLSFNIGVPAELNGMDPGEFPSGHPLAKPAENWFSWKSYIFMKVEGNIDLDDDGEKETGIALHTGSDEALRNLSFEYPLEISSEETNRIELVFDLYDLFNGEERIYPIADTPQIHSLSQLDAALEISDNLLNAIKN